MKSYDEGTEEGGSELIFGRIDRIVEDAAKTAGLTNTQFKEWNQIERIETRPKGGR